MQGFVIEKTTHFGMLESTKTVAISLDAQLAEKKLKELEEEEAKAEAESKARGITDRNFNCYHLTTVPVLE